MDFPKIASQQSLLDKLTIEMESSIDETLESMESEVDRVLHIEDAEEIADSAASEHSETK